MMTFFSNRDGFWWGKRVVDVLCLLMAFLFLIGLHREDICLVLHQWGMDDGFLLSFLFVCILLLLSATYGHMSCRRNRMPLAWYTVRYTPLFFLLIAVSRTDMVIPLLVLALIAPWMMRWIASRWGQCTTPALLPFCEISLLSVLVSFMVVALSANNDDVRLYELRIQRHLKAGDYEGALKVASKECVCSPSMMAWRAYAMARSGTLGQRLWEFPLTQDADDLFLPTSSDASLLYPLDSVKAFLGFAVGEEMNGRQLERKVATEGHLAGTPLADYWLCTLLMRKDLPAFVQWLSRCYDLKYKVGSGNLPRYYKEALILYTHRFVHPTMVYHSVQMDVNYNDYKEMAACYNNHISQSNRLRSHYGDTYWWYYDYSSVAGRVPRNDAFQIR